MRSMASPRPVSMSTGVSEVRAQLPANIEPIHVGQHQIEHDGVVLGLGELLERRGARAAATLIRNPA